MNRLLQATAPLEARIRDRGHKYREVAEILNISERQVIRLARSGALKVTRMGPRCVRIFDSAIDSYLANVRGES
jgi:excisionase family DNA binding protein